MNAKRSIELLLDLGKNPHQDPGKKRLFRAANLFILNAIFWMIVVVVWDLSREVEDDSIGPKVIPIVATFQLLVLWLNKSGKTFLALTLLNFSATSMQVFFAIRAGEEAGIHFHLISVIFCTGIMFPNRESRKYFIVNVIFLVLAVIVLLWGFINIDPVYIQPEEDLLITRRVHFIIVTFITTFFATVVLIVFNRQQNDLRKALDEKETLLSEVFHRVKNNMAVILGLINLKKNQSQSEEAVDALMQCHMRIMSMAMVHNRIYETKSLHAIQMDNYLNELSHEVLNSLNAGNSIELTTNFDPIQCDITKAIPLGLIVNEVITNSFKHAFKDGSGQLHLQIVRLDQKSGSARLTISDNGKGMIDPDGKNDNRSNSLGMTLIHSLCEQIDGQCRFYNDNGTVFEMEFPID